jgi:TPP-dependent pyruvate/acetoin dehydrogenase alpha subunit
LDSHPHKRRGHAPVAFNISGVLVARTDVIAAIEALREAVEKMR